MPEFDEEYLDELRMYGFSEKFLSLTGNIEYLHQSYGLAILVFITHVNPEKLECFTPETKDELLSYSDNSFSKDDIKNIRYLYLKNNKDRLLKELEEELDMECAEHTIDYYIRLFKPRCF
jgi:hypothetical protein